MTISVHDFINSQTEAGRQSKLEPFKADILLLKQNGFSQKQIQQFLAQNGVHAGLTTINWFIRSRLKDTDSAVENNVKKSDVVNQLTNKNLTEPDNQAAEVVIEERNQQKPNGRFNWQNPIDTEKYK